MDSTDWLLADVDGETVTFALATPGSPPRIHGVRRYKTAAFHTATDAFMQYAAESAIQLEGRVCALVVSGPVHGDTIRLARCPWIISCSGLAHILGAQPLPVNDSAVKSWANLHRIADHRLVGGSGTTDFDAPGRWVTINFATGVGGSLMVRRKGERLQNIDGEIGHIGFSPRGERETALHQALLALQRGSSWEMALFAKPGDAAWTKAGLPDRREEIDMMRAAMLGRFAADLVLAMGGWDGVFLHGRSRELLSQPRCLTEFNTAFEGAVMYRNEVRRTPRWIVAVDQSNLVGAAHMLSRIIRRDDPNP